MGREGKGENGWQKEIEWGKWWLCSTDRLRGTSFFVFPGSVKVSYHRVNSMAAFISLISVTCLLYTQTHTPFPTKGINISHVCESRAVTHSAYVFPIFSLFTLGAKGYTEHTADLTHQ